MSKQRRRSSLACAKWRNIQESRVGISGHNGMDVERSLYKALSRSLVMIWGFQGLLCQVLDSVVTCEEEGR